MRITINLYNYIIESLEMKLSTIQEGLELHHQKKQEFVSSIKSFKDIDEGKIQEILDYFGHEGFNDREDALDYLRDEIEFYQSMSDPITLYRVVGVRNKKMINKNDLGQHYTPHKWNLDGDMLLSIGSENWDDQTKPYIIEVLAPHSEIDIIQTLIQNLSFPGEHEINLKNNGRGARVVRVSKMEGW